MFLVFLGRKTSTFSSFSVVASNLREGVEVLGITPHLLNVTPHFRFARRAKRKVQAMVRCLIYPSPFEEKFVQSPDSIS